MVKNILPTSFLPSHLQRDLHLKAPSGLPGFNLPVGTDQQQVCGAHHKPLHPSGQLRGTARPQQNTLGMSPMGTRHLGLSLQSPGAEVSGMQWALDGTFPILGPHQATHQHLLCLMLEM